HSANEVIFVLIPHIVRGPEISRGSSEMLDVGTANALSLRLSNTKALVPATAPAAAPATSPASSPNQGAAPQGAASAASQVPPAQVQFMGNQVPPKPMAQNQANGGTFLFDPPTLNQAKGSTFTVNVMLSGGQNVYSVPVQLNYDPNQLEVINVSNGGFLSQDGQIVTVAHREDTTSGTIQITASRPPGAGGVSGQGAVVTLTFMAKGQGQSALTITRGGARDPAMQPIAMSGAQAAITIQ
ncbi:MAG: cohesin domain-containing protein, partial [Terriglobales bacterium]